MSEIDYPVVQDFLALDPDDHEKSTEGIRRFTRAITADPDWIVSLFPGRDGMLVAYKK